MRPVAVGYRASCHQGSLRPGKHLHQNICARSERLVNKTDVTAMRTLYIEMAEKFANEVSARMVCFDQVHVLVDV